MRPISAFAHLLPDSIIYQVASCRDSYGEITFGTPRTYRARIVGEQKLVNSFTGADVLSAHTVYVMGTLVAQPEDRITLSTGLVGSTEETAIHPPILAMKRLPDQRGTHHAVLYLG